MGIIDRVRLFRAFSDAWECSQIWEMGQVEPAAECKRSFRSGFFAGEQFATDENRAIIDRLNLEIANLEEKVMYLNSMLQQPVDVSKLPDETL